AVPAPTGFVPMVCVPRGSSGGAALASLPLGYGGAIDRGDNVRAFEMIDVRSIALLDFPESQRYRLVDLGIDLVAADIEGTAAGVHGPRANPVLRQRQEIIPGLGPLLSARLVVVCGGPGVVERRSVRRRQRGGPVHLAVFQLDPVVEHRLCLSIGG